MIHSKRFLELVEHARPGVRTISSDEVARKLKEEEDFLLIDTREDNEWERGHVTGAVHLGKGIIERDIEGVAPDTDQQIVLYCGGGFRSVLAAEALQKMGYTNVASMDGGWREWFEKGLPTSQE